MCYPSYNDPGCLLVKTDFKKYVFLLTKRGSDSCPEVLGETLEFVATVHVNSRP